MEHLSIIHQYQEILNTAENTYELPVKTYKLINQKGSLNYDEVIDELINSNQKLLYSILPVSKKEKGFCKLKKLIVSIMCRSRLIVELRIIRIEKKLKIRGYC